MNKAPIPTDPVDRARAWPPLREGLAIALWCSFLAACLGALLCFAYIDPATAGMGDRKTAYSIAFFFFWFIGSVAAGLSIYMSRTGPSRRDPNSSTP
jgi:hypothetical protein